MKCIWKFGQCVCFVVMVSGAFAEGGPDQTPQKKDRDVSLREQGDGDLVTKHATLHDLFVIGSPAPQSLEGQERLRLMGPTGCSYKNLAIAASKDVPQMGAVGTELASHIYPEVIGSFGRDALSPLIQKEITTSLKPILMMQYNRRTNAE